MLAGISGIHCRRWNRAMTFFILRRKRCVKCRTSSGNISLRSRKVERGTEKHSSEREIGSELLLDHHRTLDHGSSRQSNAHLSESVRQLPNRSKLPLYAAREQLVCSREEFLLFRPGKICRHRPLRTANAVRYRSCKCAFLVPEQLHVPANPSEWPRS